MSFGVVIKIATNTKIDESLHIKKPVKKPVKKPLKLRCLGGLFVLENHKKDQEKNQLFNSSDSPSTRITT